MTFSTLGLAKPILKALQESKYSAPTPIQAKAIPAILSGRDVMAAAQTGTGKTASFALPLLERLTKSQQRLKSCHARSLILTPTRELAAQIHESILTYGKYINLKSAVIFGGVSAVAQAEKLRKGVDILIATPGRLIDLHQQNAIKFDQLETLVFDEADRMLDMGFIHDIRKILRFLPDKRQTLMFSATFSNDIITLAKKLVRRPIEISIDPKQTTAITVKQWLSPVNKKKKASLLVHLIKSKKWQQVLVFTKTKRGANRLAETLENESVSAAAIHGNKSQGARTRALSEFKSNQICVLVATDIAARGLDIDQLPVVVNFDLPNVPEDYVHRIGRTGRAGLTGQAVSLVCAEEYDLLNAIECLIKNTLDRQVIEGFEPCVELPHSHLNRRPTQQKKTSLKKKPTTKPRSTKKRKPKNTKK